MATFTVILDDPSQFRLRITADDVCWTDGDEIVSFEVGDEGRTVAWVAAAHILAIVEDQGAPS